jgi:hypothetical protein
MGSLISIILKEGDKRVIPAGIKHRIIEEQGKAKLQLGEDIKEDFKLYKTPVTYYCFSGSQVYRSPLTSNN